MKAANMWDWFPFPRIRAFTDKDKASRFIKKETEGDFELRWLGKSAQTDYYRQNGSESLAVITLDTEEGTAQKAALLAHECSHVVDSWLEDIGEHAAGEEIRAYAIQCAMLAALSQLGEEWLTQQTSKSRKG